MESCGSSRVRESDRRRAAEEAARQFGGALNDLRAPLADLSLATEDLAIHWPEIAMPEPECAGDGPALVSSDMDLVEAIDVLPERY